MYVRCRPSAVWDVNLSSVIESALDEAASVELYYLEVPHSSKPEHRQQN